MRRLVFLCFLGCLLGLPAGLYAGAPELGYRSAALRLGFGLNPHQVVLGGSGNFGTLFPHTDWLIPVVEVGLGDDVTWLSVTTSLQYRVQVDWGGWTPLVGGDLGLQAAYRQGGEEDTTELGFSALLGLDRPTGEDGRFGLELKFAIIEAPALRFMATWANGL